MWFNGWNICSPRQASWAHSSRALGSTQWWSVHTYALPSNCICLCFRSHFGCNMYWKVTFIFSTFSSFFLLFFRLVFRRLNPLRFDIIALGKNDMAREWNMEENFMEKLWKKYVRKCHMVGEKDGERERERERGEWVRGNRLWPRIEFVIVPQESTFHSFSSHFFHVPDFSSFSLYFLISFSLFISFFFLALSSFPHLFPSGNWRGIIFSCHRREEERKKFLREKKR